MMPGPQIPEDVFRAEGHCCAITLPGLRDGNETVDFPADEKLRAYLRQSYGMETDTPSGEPREGDGDGDQSTVIAKGEGVVASR